MIEPPCSWSDWSFLVGLVLGGGIMAIGWGIYILDCGRRARPWLDREDGNADN